MFWTNFNTPFQRRGSLTSIKMPWNTTDELTLDDQILKMIGPIPPCAFQHRKLEIRKLCVEGYNGYKKKISDEYNVEFKPDYQIGNGRFGKVFKGTSLDNSTVFAFKGILMCRHNYVLSTRLSAFELRHNNCF